MAFIFMVLVTLNVLFPFELYAQTQQKFAQEALTMLLQESIKAGDSKYEIRQLFQGIKEPFYFNNESIYNIFIDRCIARVEFLTITDFIYDCRYRMENSYYSVAEQEVILEWMLYVVQKTSN